MTANEKRLIISLLQFKLQEHYEGYTSEHEEDVKLMRSIVKKLQKN